MAGKSAVISVIVTGEASGAKKAFEQGEEAAKGFRKEAEKVEKGFEGLRDGADNSERRIVGFRDSLTGTGDVMKGLRDGDMVTLATGFADLSSSVANLGADLLDWGKKGIQAGKDFVQGQAAVYAAKAKDVVITGAQKAANLASTAATQAQTAAQWLLNAAMNANPVLLVVTALAALTAGFVIAYKNSETFRDIVHGALDVVLDVAKAVSTFFTEDIPAAFQATVDKVGDVLGWVRDNWPLLLGILTGPIGLAAYFISQHWEDIKGGFTSVKNWVQTKVDELIGFVTSIPDRFGDLLTRLGDFGEDMGKSLVNGLIAIWNKADLRFPRVEVPSWVPGIGGRGFGGFDVFPDIPYLARGTRNFPGGLAVIGEDGPELVNLPRGSSVTPAAQTAAMLGGGAPIIIYGDVYGFDDFARKVRDAQASNVRRGI